MFRLDRASLAPALVRRVEADQLAEQFRATPARPDGFSAVLAGRGLRGGPEIGYNGGLFQITAELSMKADIHPKYNHVVFQDVTSDFIILTRSTLTSKEKIKWEDGNEYPLVKVEVSSASHPFYTGKQKLMDTSGRVDKFRKRYGAAKPEVAKDEVAK
jgi:large subunit ribosomal protein L31